VHRITSEMSHRSMREVTQDVYISSCIDVASSSKSSRIVKLKDLRQMFRAYSITLFATLLVMLMFLVMLLLLLVTVDEFLRRLARMSAWIMVIGVLG